MMLVQRMRLPGRCRWVANIIVPLVDEMIRIGKHGRRGGESTVRCRKSNRDGRLHTAVGSGRTVLCVRAVVGRWCEIRSRHRCLNRRLFNLYRYDTFLRRSCRRLSRVRRLRLSIHWSLLRIATVYGHRNRGLRHGSHWWTYRPGRLLNLLGVLLLNRRRSRVLLSRDGHIGRSWSDVVLCELLRRHGRNRSSRHRGRCCDDRINRFSSGWSTLPGGAWRPLRHGCLWFVLLLQL